MMRTAIQYLPLLILAGLWEAVTRLGLVPPDLLPSVSAVAAAFADMVRDGTLISNGAQSIMRAAAGLASAIVVGFLLGAGMALQPRFHAVVGPVVQSFYPLPKTALVPLVMIWFGLGDMGKIVLIFLGCLLPVTLGTYNGILGVDRVLVWSARSLGAAQRDVLMEVLLPAALPQILTGLRTATAFAFLLMVASELIIANNGLGYLIGSLGDNGAYPAMYASILTVIALGFFADRAFAALSAHLLRWRA
jgi:ABC-type nitrate/sulfonate/bicarbonate transport system permease component